VSYTNNIAQYFDFVIPAKAGIQAALLQEVTLMDSRLRGNDEGKNMP